MRFLPIPDLTELDIYRFWCYVLKKDGCWDWVSTGGKGSTGYARPSFTINYQHYKAARVLWKIIHSIDPNKLLVLHKCNNIKCVNPDHFYLGTQSDNMKNRHKDNPDLSKGVNNSRLN